MNKLIRHAALFVIMAGLLACAASRPKPEWVAVPDADIAGQASFGWEAGAISEPASLLDSRIRDALRTELRGKGYTESDASPDLVIDWDVLSHEEPQGSSPVSIGIGIGSWGSHVGGSVGASVPVGSPGEPRTTNRITVRAIDAQGNREVWIGTTTSIGTASDGADIRDAISDLMEGFPEKRR